MPRINSSSTHFQPKNVARVWSTYGHKTSTVDYKGAERVVTRLDYLLAWASEKEKRRGENRVWWRERESNISPNLFFFNRHMQLHKYIKEYTGTQRHITIKKNLSMFCISVIYLEVKLWTVSKHNIELRLTRCRVISDLRIRDMRKLNLSSSWKQCAGHYFKSCFFFNKTYEWYLS